jgi:hypothetical protein
VMGPSALVMTGMLQASVASATPGAGTPDGLQPKFAPAGQNMNKGAVLSTIHVNTCVQVDVLAQASLAV